jgi:hypothetical protein
MTTALVSGRNQLRPIVVSQLDQHAPSIYLASLAIGSRRTMRGALETIATVLTGGRCDAFTLPWPRLPFPSVIPQGKMKRAEGKHRQ